MGKEHLCCIDNVVMVGCYAFSSPETVFQSVLGHLPEKEKEKIEE